MFFTNIEDIDCQILYYLDIGDIVNLLSSGQKDMILKTLPAFINVHFSTYQFCRNGRNPIPLIVKLIEIDQPTIATIMIGKIYQCNHVHFSFLFGKILITDHLPLFQLFFGNSPSDFDWENVASDIVLRADLILHIKYYQKLLLALIKSKKIFILFMKLGSILRTNVALVR